MSENESQPPELVILPRPQIAVGLNEDGDVVIATSRINDGYDGVDHDEVAIPLCDLREVIGALQAIADRRGV